MLYDRWRQIAREFQADIALVDAASGQQWTFQELARAAEQDSPLQPSLVFPRGRSCPFVLSVLRAWRSQIPVCPLEEGQPEVNFRGLPGGCVHLKTTSASTGHARYIAFTAEQLQADVDQIVATMGLRREWPNVAVISLAHSYGFSSLVLPLLLVGIPLIIANAPLPESLRQAAQKAPEITLPAVPALWRAWVDAEAVPPNVRLAISAGAPLPLALERQTFDRFGFKIHNFYGASECGGIAFDTSLRPREDPSGVGSAMRNVHLTVNEAGCLSVVSPAVGLTYWPDPDPSLSQGCYRSSDLARIQGGLVYLSGRQTDQINVAGRKVSPESIERVLSAHPDVRACVVFGVPSPDKDRTEMIIACVEANGTTTAESLKQHLIHHLPAWQVPRDWWFVPTLQTNARGKLARSQWRERFLNRAERRAPFRRL